MAGIKAKITGFNELRERLNKAVKKFPGEVNAELQVAANTIRGKAIQAAPADQGLLRAEIQVTSPSAFNWGVFSNALYSGYVEFGTKSNVQVPPELQSVASQIRGRASSSLDVKKAIFDWCRRKGIDEKLWYPIFIKIMVQGIKAHPYFFPQLEASRPALIKNLENLLKAI